MIQGGKYLRVQSELNDWIDFIIVLLNEEQIGEAEKIIESAYDDWFSNKSDETIADYICKSLYEAGIEHETYFKDSEY